MSKPIIALIYDFDKTLSPRDMQEYAFLPSINIEPAEFWEMCRVFAVENQTDGILAYMYMMTKAARGSINLTRDALTGLGKSVEFFPGVESWFDLINKMGSAMGMQVEHYIISSGLKEIIEGSSIGKKFKAIFAASFCYDENGTPIWPATALNYTSKTQYLFRINKGILDITNDRDLNAYTPEYERRVPFSNMIYIGDGLTDVPCMKMVKQKGGYSVVVHKTGDHSISDEMLLHGRADFAAPCDYTENGELMQIIGELFRRISASHRLSVRHALQVQRARARAGEDVPLDIPMRGGLEEGEGE